MIKPIEQIKQWIQKRDRREQVVLFFLSLLIIYYVWHFIFIRPVVNAQEDLKKQISELKSQRDTIQQQFEAIQAIVNTKEFVNLISKQHELTLETETVKQKISDFRPIFVAESDFSKLTKDILGQIDQSITLISLKELPDQHWMPEVDKSVTFVQDINQHELAIEFRANYFDTLAYLVRLEKLPWHLYWDSLEYKVIKYPEADVIVQFYVLSNQKSV